MHSTCLAIVISLGGGKQFFRPEIVVMETAILFAARRVHSDAQCTADCWISLKHYGTSVRGRVENGPGKNVLG